MAFDVRGTLYAVANFTLRMAAMSQAIVAVVSDDDWASAHIEAQVATDGGASTLALKDGVPYYIDSYTSDPEAQQYQIVHAELEAGLIWSFTDGRGFAERRRA